MNSRSLRMVMEDTLRKKGEQLRELYFPALLDVFVERLYSRRVHSSLRSVTPHKITRIVIFHSFENNSNIDITKSQHESKEGFRKFAKDLRRLLPSGILRKKTRL